MYRGWLRYMKCAAVGVVACGIDHSLQSVGEETRELPGERDNARNNARCTQARKGMHGLDGHRQHQDMDRTLRRRINQNDRGQG